MSAPVIRVDASMCNDPRNIAFIADSCCDVPSAYVESHPTFIVPLMVNYEDASYLDGIEITPREVYSRMPDLIPQTSTPTPACAHAVFESVQEQGFTHVICLTLSSGCSGTHDLLRSVAATYPDLHTEIIDTLNLGIGAGCIAMHAMDRYDAGDSFERIVKSTRAMVPRTHLYVVADTLEYLYRGGRISKTVYSMGSVLNLRPVLGVTPEGTIDAVAKARGRKKSLSKGIDECRKHVGKKPYRLAVAGADAEEDVRRCLEILHEKYPHAEQIIDAGDISPALVVHTGPGLVGFVVQELA